MEFASSSPSFSESKPKGNYDVFISFGGKDICRAFVSHLHSALSGAEVNTFLHDEDMRAIEGSQIAIVVFSKSYAEATWCLDDLEKIIECHEFVMPVFYEIDPSEVRHQKGDFGKAVKAAAQKRFSGEHLESGLSRWSRSLSQVANLCGWVQSNFRNEAKLVREVVDHILSKLDYEVLPITKFPVGLESRMKKVIEFIEEQSNNGCSIGIWGMGGSGKTTLAKAIYNRIHRTFMDKIFIEDIREVCKTKGRGHVHLQERLLSNILKGKVKIQSIGKGTTMIKERLCGKKLLIVLDNVNEMSQLHLCGNRVWFGQGTVIIITTRNLRLLDRFKVDYLYEMPKMDEKESLELFSWHAFGEAKPREDFNEFARNVVAYCGGLPLALQVLGSYLFGQTSKEVWESLLSKPEITPNDQVLKKLRISFDDLQDQMEKDIFLDICCFFIGVDRAYVIDILNGCGLYADIGITVLIECSLIKLEKNNKLGIHPLVREMGRQIICESSRKELGKRSRLWFQGDVLYVLEKNTGTKAIEGLALKLHLTNKDIFIKADAFKKMKNLRLLQLDNVQLTGDYGYLSKQLRWIRWKGFPRRYIPNNFYLEGAIAIDLKHSNLRLVWKDPQDLGWLKILNLSHSKYLKETPEFSKLPNLEKLILKDCPSLCKVHKSIGELRNLVLLNLKDCKSLANLPRRVYKLKSVKSLILSGSSKIYKLEEDIVQMESLTTLFAKNTAVTRVPFSIVRSKSIDYVSLCGYEGLSHNVFPSIIWSWMSPKMNPLTRIHSFSGTSSYLVSMDLQNNNLGDLALVLSNLSNLLGVVVQDTKFQLSKQLRTTPDDAYGVNFAELEIASDSSQISNQYRRSCLIGIGCYHAVFNILIDCISKGLATNESCDIFLPSDNYPYWLAHTGEGHSVYFTMPKDCCIKGMTLWVVYLSTCENIATKCPVSVLMVNYTKCTMQIHKQDTITFNVDWQGIISHLGPGDKVEIFVIFGNGLAIKKTSVYLMCDESIGMEIKPSPKTKMEIKPSPKTKIASNQKDKKSSIETKIASNQKDKMRLLEAKVPWIPKDKKPSLCTEIARTLGCTKDIGYKLKKKHESTCMKKQRENSDKMS